MIHARGSAYQDAQADEMSRPDTYGRWCRLFRGQESELRPLRRWLTSLLPDRAARDDLISVAVELGTNAIQHTSSGQGGSFTVEVTHRDAMTRIDVTDGGAPSGPQITDDPMSDCGRGLIIVRALSESCGVRGDARGRTVWAEVAWTSEPVVASPATFTPVAVRNRVSHLDGHHLTRPAGHSGVSAC
jgi:anti-sigma regulatory factor (Ser/Thr protein kinase)